MTDKEKDKKPANDIRVSFKSRIGSIVSYCEKLLKENNMKELTFSAVGGSIGTLVSVVELLKTIQPGLYQTNRLATICYQSVEEGEQTGHNERLYPKLEVKLYTEKPTKVPIEGFQEKMSEEERKQLLDLHNKRKEERRRGGMRRGFRGRRPGFRGGMRRGGFRGQRRGGFRGQRRGGFRGQRRGGYGFRGPLRAGARRPPMRGRGARGGRRD